MCAIVQDFLPLLITDIHSIVKTDCRNRAFFQIKGLDLVHVNMQKWVHQNGHECYTAASAPHAGELRCSHSGRDMPGIFLAYFPFGRYGIMAGGGSSLLGLALASRTYSLGRQVKQCDV